MKQNSLEADRLHQRTAIHARTVPNRPLWEETAEGVKRNSLHDGPQQTPMRDGGGSETEQLGGGQAAPEDRYTRQDGPQQTPVGGDDGGSETEQPSRRSPTDPCETHGGSETEQLSGRSQQTPVGGDGGGSETEQPSRRSPTDPCGRRRRRE